MIVLDTNVVSELMRDHPNEDVVRFFDRNKSDQLLITAISIAEILYGLGRLAPGRRRSDLDAAFARFLDAGFRNKVLPFDQSAANRYAGIVVERQRIGRRMEAFDAMIASIALVHGAKVATRDTADFADCGVDLINPWEP